MDTNIEIVKIISEIFAYILPVALIYFIIVKYEITDLKKDKVKDSHLTQLAIITSSIVFTTIWYGELEGPNWAPTFELLIVLFWLCAAQTLKTGVDKMCTLPTAILVVGSSLAQMWMRNSTAWIPIVCFFVEISMTIFLKKSTQTTLTLFLATSCQLAIIWYYKEQECTQGLEICLICVLATVSFIVSGVYGFYTENRNLVSCFYLVMITVMMIVNNIYSTCLSENAAKWIGIASVVIYFHVAGVYFLVTETMRNKKSVDFADSLVDTIPQVAEPNFKRTTMTDYL